MTSMDSIFTLKDLVHMVIDGRWQGSICTEDGQDGALLVQLQQVRPYYERIQYQDKVVVLVSNTVETIIALLCIWELGGVVVPVKCDIAEAAVQGIAEDCSAQYVLDPVTKSLLPIAHDRVQCLAVRAFKYLTEPKLTGVDLALIIYTSGSTGKPKGIMLTHANVISALRSILGYMDIRQSDTILLISPLSFDYGLYQLFFCLATHCKLVLCQKSVNPISVINVIEKCAVTVLPLVPAMAIGMFKFLEKFKIYLPSVRLITSTGGIFPAHVAQGLKQQFSSADVIKMYGLTESKRVAYLPAKYLEQAGESVGFPMPGLDAKVFKEIVASNGCITLEELPRGEIGQLFVRGGSVFQRYFNPDNGGGAKLYGGAYRDDNWLATGDLFMQDQDGFLYFKGRSKDLIKQRGFCIYPRELENIVYRNPLVKICVVAGVTDSSGNEIAKLFVSLTEYGDEVQKSFKNWLKSEIDPDYMFGEIQFVTQMPMSLNGKIDVSKLVSC